MCLFLVGWGIRKLLTPTESYRVGKGNAAKSNFKEIKKYQWCIGDDPSHEGFQL